MYLIVGLDPGTTVGIGILNFKGQVVSMYSSKNMSVNGVINYINQFGNAAIIASDVDHIPNFVYKVATSYDAKIHIPEKNLSVEEKVFLTRNIKYNDTHQRDSLSAAIYAYKNYKNLFNKIDNLGYGDDVKYYVVKGYSISEAIAKVMPEEKIESTMLKGLILEEEKETVDLKKFAIIKENLKILEKSRKILRQQIIEKDKEINALKEKIHEMEKERKLLESKLPDNYVYTIKTLEISLESLKKDISLMQDKINSFYEIYKKIGKGEIIPVGVYPEIFNGLTYVEKHKKINKNDFLNVSVAFVESDMDLQCRTVDAKYLKNFDNILFYIEKKDLEKIKEFDIEEIINNYKKYRKKGII